jgi:hypothetical protein
VNAKLALLTVRAWVALAPAAVAVIVSGPATLPVTVAVNWPEPLVLPETGEMVFNLIELIVTGIPFNPVVNPAESFRLNVSVVVALSAMEPLPLIEIVVPMTSTLLLAEAASAVAVIAIVRLALLLPRLSLAVTSPFALDTLLALKVLKNTAPGCPSSEDENVTVLPLTAWLVALSTTAVRSTVFVVPPAEGICGLLTSN